MFGEGIREDLDYDEEEPIPEEFYRCVDECVRGRENDPRRMTFCVHSYCWDTAVESDPFDPDLIPIE